MATNLIKFTRALSATFELADIDQLLELYSDYICAPAVIQDRFKELKTKILADMRRLAALTTNADYKATLDALLAGHPAEYSGLISSEPAETVADYAKRSIADMYKLIRATFPFAPIDPTAVERNLKELCKVFKSIYRYKDRLYLSDRPPRCLTILEYGDRAMITRISFISIDLNKYYSSITHHTNEHIKRTFIDTYVSDEPVTFRSESGPYNGDIDIGQIIKIGVSSDKQVNLRNDGSLGSLSVRLAGFWYLLAEIDALKKELKECAKNEVKAKCRIERFNAIKLEYDWATIAQVAAEPPPTGPECEYSLLNYMIANHMEWFYSLLATRPYSTLTDEEINIMTN
jgi:hypothetical protein